MGVAALELVLEMLVAKRKVRSPPSVDRGAAQQEHRRFADNRGAMGKRGRRLKRGGTRSVGRQVTGVVVRQVGSEATTGGAKGPTSPAQVRVDARRWA